MILEFVEWYMARYLILCLFEFFVCTFSVHSINPESLERSNRWASESD